MNLKINIPFYVSENQLSYLKIIDLDQYSLYGGLYTQVNDRFQEH